MHSQIILKFAEDDLPLLDVVLDSNQKVATV